MIETPILNVLKSLQQHGNTYIVGGYLRDKLLKIKPKDVDLVTTIPFEELKRLIPSIYATEQGNQIGVGRFQKNGFSFEITSISNSIEKEIQLKDFTINALYHDGNSLYDLNNSQKDIKNRIIRPLDDFINHCEEHPQAYLRAIRIASKINGEIDTSLLYLMKNNLDIFFRNNENRIRQEGYEIIHCPYPQIAISILNELGFIKKKTSLLNQPLKFNPQDIPYTLSFLSLYSDVETIKDFASLFKFKQQYIEEMDEILTLDSSKIDNSNPKKLQKTIKWNRYKYQLEPEKLEEFFKELKNRLS